MRLNIRKVGLHENHIFTEFTKTLNFGVCRKLWILLLFLRLLHFCVDIHLVSEYGRRPLRSSTDRTLTVPRTHNRFGDRSFAVAGPRLWNSLPISLQQISTYGQFRRYLKNHIFGF